MAISLQIACNDYLFSASKGPVIFSGRILIRAHLFMEFEESAKLRALRAMRACVPDACFMSFSAC